MRRPALLLALVGVGVALLRRRSRSAQADELWHEATTAPDLR